MKFEVGFKLYNGLECLYALPDNMETLAVTVDLDPGELYSFVKNHAHTNGKIELDFSEVIYHDRVLQYQEELRKKVEEGE